jgi:glycosyltransferase involved in cell wall biosynthesis
VVTPHISVVIPAFNEERYLPRLLDSIDAARFKYARGSDAVEVIVADNCSTDLTAEVARSRNCHVALVTKRAIAAARNGGAAVAKGEIVCFIDADSAIHPDSFNAVEAAIADGRYVAGATGVYLERMSLGLIVTLFLLMPIVWITGMDTGLVFARREDVNAVGGYDEELLYAEDVKFLWSMRRLGRKRGQALTRLSGVKALGSTRKFDEHGDWHYFSMSLGWIASYFTGKQAAISKYWYKPGR